MKLKERNAGDDLTIKQDSKIVRPEIVNPETRRIC
jgi:hypothetical protein